LQLQKEKGLFHPGSAQALALISAQWSGGAHHQRTKKAKRGHLHSSREATHLSEGKNRKGRKKRGFIIREFVVRGGGVTDLIRRVNKLLFYNLEPWGEFVKGTVKRHPISEKGGRMIVGTRRGSLRTKKNAGGL